MSGAKAVHRLIDIVVEEVSLVDRAANKHRFLLVKRDEGEGVDDDNDEMDQDDDATGEGAGEPTVGIAAKALASLTDAVEQLASEGTASKEAIAKTVSELDTAARELAKAAGIGVPASGGGDPLEGVRAALAQVRAMIDGAKPPVVPATPAAKNDQAGQPSPDGAGGQGKLEGLLAQVAALAKGLTDQQQLGQRLAQLEKHFGVPRSTPAGERRASAAEDDDEGWSLDLNRPVDRESVDKSVSFHDL